MADYRALIANCPMIGELPGTKAAGGTGYLDTIKLHLGQFDLELVEVPAIVTRNLGESKGEAVYTTDLYIRGISANQFDAAERLASEVAELLSLAACSMVMKFGYQFHDTDHEGQEQLITGHLQYFRPVIHTHSGASIREFLERTWPTYQRLRDVRKLNIAFQYHAWAQASGPPMELNLLTTFALLENLKHTFAIEQGYPFIKGFFRSHGATNSQPGRSRSFRSLLQEMLKAVGMTPNLDAIIDMRNELVHSGLSLLSMAGYRNVHGASHDILREYLLRLLQYSGSYFSYSSPNVPRTI